jgi:1-phosphofructokinase
MSGDPIVDVRTATVGAGRLGTGATIVTVTPNPSIDRTLEVRVLEVGRVNRAVEALVGAGGKGVNVARALAANGIDTCAVLPVGGPDGQLLTSLLTGPRLQVRAVATAGKTRTNITISELGGQVTKVNEPGAPMAARAIDELLWTTTDALAGARWLVGCGSLPERMSIDFYAELVRRGHRAGVRVAIDTSGEPLAAALAAGPDLIKPNIDELAELVGQDLITVEDVIRAAESIRSRGVGVVVVSLGARGAVLVDGDEPLLAVPPPVVARSDVGAGDSLLAGFLAAEASREHALRAGVAWGAAAVSLPGTSVPEPTDIHLDAVSLAPVRGEPSPTG